MELPAAQPFTSTMYTSVVLRIATAHRGRSDAFTGTSHGLVPSLINRESCKSADHKSCCVASTAALSLRFCSMSLVSSSQIARCRVSRLSNQVQADSRHNEIALRKRYFRDLVRDRPHFRVQQLMFNWTPMGLVATRERVDDSKGREPALTSTRGPGGSQFLQYPKKRCIENIVRIGEELPFC